MANWLATPMMIAKELAIILPSDAVVSTKELPNGDIQAEFGTCGGIGSVKFSQKERALSMNEMRELAKPQVTEQLLSILTVDNSFTGESI